MTLPEFKALFCGSPALRLKALPEFKVLLVAEAPHSGDIHLSVT